MAEKLKRGEQRPEAFFFDEATEIADDDALRSDAELVAPFGGPLR